MSYTLLFKDQTVDPVGKQPITVAVGTVDSTSTDLVLTGKGAANHGKLQQENLLRLLENFASPTPPTNPTIGQLWYDSTKLTLKVLISASPDTWKSINGTQVTDIGDPPPSPAALGDMWFQQTGTASGFLYVFTGLGRYPTTATTIGGWEQIFPKVDTFAGREEYDSLRELLEQMAGEGVSSYGSGAIGRSLTNLTNFAALDLDLRLKYQALGLDSNVLVSPASDGFIAHQAPSTTAFILTDGAGGPSGANDFFISGSRNNTSTPGSILLNGVVMILPITASPVPQQFFVEDALVMYDSAVSVFPGFPYLVIRFNDASGSWEYDNNVAWVPFAPTATCYAIGTMSTYQQDNNTLSPGGKNGFLWAHAVPMVGSKFEHLKVEPNSQDWDELLAATKYAVSRLEVPPGFVKAICGIPFVVDGRQAPSTLTGLSSTDVRYPCGHRRSNRRAGAVTQMNAFNETVNAMNTGITNRFSLKGINGAAGTNPSFNPSVSVSAVVASTSSTLAAAIRTCTIDVSFASHDEFYRWMGAGHALQVELVHSGGANPSDGNLTAALATIGTWRFTADKCRIFGQSLPLTMTRPAVDAGIWNGVSSTVLTSQVVGTVSVTVLASRLSGSSFRLQLQLNANSTLSGLTIVSVKNVSDAETYLPGPLATYPLPNSITTTF